MTFAEHDLDPREDEATAGGAGALPLRLNGFAGSLDLLLELARTHRIDLKTLDLLAVVEQLIGATRADAAMPLSRKAAWTVTASWLLLLRSHMMLPSADPRHPAAAEQASQLQAQLLSLQQARNLAQWLDERPQLGRDVIGRGASEPDTATRAEPGHLDRVEFLWACIALFVGDWSTAAIDLPAVYVPRPQDLYRVEDARDRVRKLMQDVVPTDMVSLARLLPLGERSRQLVAQAEPTARIRHRSAWTSTLIACLELAKQGELVIEQLENAALPAF
ncbi:MAG: segregation and condensation protein A [Janthinobacterium lividum]